MVWKIELAKVSEKWTGSAQMLSTRINQLLALYLSQHHRESVGFFCLVMPRFQSSRTPLLAHLHLRFLWSRDGLIRPSAGWKKPGAASENQAADELFFSLA